MLRFRLVKPAGKDILFQLLLRQRAHGFGRGMFLEQFFRHFVYSLVRALRGENDRHQKLVGAFVVKGGTGVGI